MLDVHYVMYVTGVLAKNATSRFVLITVAVYPHQSIVTWGDNLTSCWYVDDAPDGLRCTGEHSNRSEPVLYLIVGNILGETTHSSIENAVQ